MGSSLISKNIQYISLASAAQIAPKAQNVRAYYRQTNRAMRKKKNPHKETHLSQLGLNHEGHFRFVSDYYQCSLTTDSNQMGCRFMPFTTHYSLNNETRRRVVPLILLARR